MSSTALAVLRANPQEDEPIPLALDQDLPLQEFIDFVSETLEVKILYTEDVLAESNQRVFLRGIGNTEGVSRQHLLILLKSALRAKGLALVDAEIPSWKRIVRIADARPYLAEGSADQFEAGDLVTQVFHLDHIRVTQAEAYIAPFLSDPGQNRPESIVEQNLLIVTDFVGNMRRIEERIEMLDAAPEEVVRVFRDLRHRDADDLKSRLEEILAAQQAAASGRPLSVQGEADAVDSDPASIHPHLIADPTTNRLVMIGRKRDIDSVNALIDELDVDEGWETHVYSFAQISPRRVDELLRQLLGESRAETYESIVDEHAGRLIIKARPEIHQQVQALRDELERQPPPQLVTGQSGQVRYYRPQFVRVRDILDTLQAVERGTFAQRFAGRGIGRGPSARGIQSYGDPFEHLAPYGWPPLSPLEQGLPLETGGEELSSQQPEGPAPFGPPSVLPGEARLTVDEQSNTLIVVADPDIQELYRQLIEWLDRPRPQVMIEAKVVAVDASDETTIGIEVSSGDRSGSRRLFAFSSHGLSAVDATTGALALLPGLGFNGTLVDPDVADVIVRALSDHRRARVVTAPRILVNDNSTGALSSVDEVPFTSLNASQTVSTTSFAGFAEAGTSIQVTPHVSQGDHLQLEFRITVNDFSGTGGAGVPPPRQTNEVISEVTVPDGHTIIVGGLRRKRITQELESIPILDQIPILRLLAGTETNDADHDAIFVFLRPVILRDDKFADLRALSRMEREQAGIPHDYPYSEPVLIR